MFWFKVVFGIIMALETIGQILMIDRERPVLTRGMVALNTLINGGFLYWVITL